MLGGKSVFCPQKAGTYQISYRVTLSVPSVQPVGTRLLISSADDYEGVIAPTVGARQFECTITLALPERTTIELQAYSTTPSIPGVGGLPLGCHPSALQHKRCTVPLMRVGSVLDAQERLIFYARLSPDTLARELSPRGTVLCCTTTRILPPDHLPVLLSPGEEAVSAALADHGCACLGTPAENGKSFILVEISGIEPLTSWMPSKRSPAQALYCPSDEGRECLLPALDNVQLASGASGASMLVVRLSD